jgi:Uma2 family endonuclease
MGEPKPKAATYEDLLAVPPHLVAEIIDGRLVTHSRAIRHSYAVTSLLATLGDCFRQDRPGPGGWWLLHRPDLHLVNGQVVVPDLAGWRRERLPAIPDVAFMELAPDWVCAVISPSTARYDRLEKRRIYAETGVGHLWFIDPESRTLEAFELREGPPRSDSKALAHHNQWLLIATRGNDDEVAVAPFAAAPFTLDILWAD